jgi:hypothetical protein
LRAYSYSATEAGFRSWPDGLLRLDGVEHTDNPNEANLFICPGTLALFPEPEDLIRRLPYYRGREARHVFIAIDESPTIYDSPALFFRCNLKTYMKARDINALALPWPVDDFAECIDVPAGGFIYDVSFHGWVFFSLRFEATDSCQAQGLQCDFALYPNFTGHIYHEPEGLRRRCLFRQSMKHSRLALCPESVPGDFPYRFFEAMSAGRIPVLVGSDQVFPFADEIPYNDFTIHVPRGEVSHTGKILAQYLDQISDVELIERGKLARQYWERYLDREKWPQLMTYAVKKSFHQKGWLAEVPVL